MKFSEEKKQTIKLYILDKILHDNVFIAKSVASTFQVNPSTIHAYMNELLTDNVIRKVKRGQYELVSQDFLYELSRKKGDLDSDIHVFNMCLDKHIAGLNQNIYDIWSYGFSEMINNVMDHSLSENVSIRIIRDYLNTSVVIDDNGIGIFEKIKDYFHLASVDEAICELFKGKLTTDNVNHSGEGIFFTSKMMDEFFIISSNRVFTNNKYDDSKIINITNPNKKGTCVFMTLSNFSHKTAKDIFDAYANIDGGFIKTRIPLKNIFDTSPVSRSQAKRICNNLDKFKEVIIDFEEIEWMGQGFAHQIFVVFANAHPDIEIIPTNMNEDVTRMFNHVKQP